VLHKVLAGKVGWVSPVTFHRSEADLLQSALKELRREGASSLVLDLRSPCADADFDAAAEMLDLFVPPAEVLFKLQQVGRSDAELFLSRETALWSEPVVVLIDCDSCNVAETIAAVLKDRGAALLMGQPTRGATVRFETQPIDSEFSLRFARAEMLLPDGTSLFRKGLVPEFPVAMDAETKIAAVELQRERSTPTSAAVPVRKPKRTGCRCATSFSSVRSTCS
jgi:C-terminal processing protease CtpA/Prc